MKKTVLFGIVLMFLLSFSVSAESIFEDYFERESIGSDWNVTATTSNTVTIVSDEVVFSDQSSSGEGAITKYYKFKDDDMIEIKWKTSDLAKVSQVIRLEGTGGGQAVYIQTASGKFIVYNGETITDITGLSNNQYYVIQIKNINFTAKTFDIYIDDVDKGSFAFRNNFAGSNGLYFLTGTSNAATGFNNTVDYVKFCSDNRCDGPKITAKDIYDNSTINSFNATISNSTENIFISTTNGTIICESCLANNLYNISIESENYFDRTYLNYNITGNLESELIPYYYFHNYTYHNFVEYNNTNYTRNLNYSFYLTCRTGSNTVVNFLLNNTEVATHNIICTNSSSFYSFEYINNEETLNTTKINILSNDTILKEYANNVFQWDLNPPSAVSNFESVSVFDTVANVSLFCSDSISPILTYNLTFNNNLLFYSNLSNNSTTFQAGNFTDGNNTAIGLCSDFFSSTTSRETKFVYSHSMFLIDEMNKNYFDVSNITDARVYYSNDEFYSFTDESTNMINITIIDNTKLRFRFEYAPQDGQEVIITRYVDLSLVEGDLRVCVNKEGVTHYEQIVVSSSERPVVLKSTFANCLIGADYTRFAYQDAFTLKSFSSTTMYYLYTYDAGNQVLLASVDGSITTFLNIDTLEFKKQGYNFNFLGEAINFYRDSDTQVRIFYENKNEDNTAIDVKIKDIQTNTLVFTSSDFADPNNFTLYFNTATLENNETTVYQLIIDKTTESGTSTIKRYFNINAKSGYISNSLAMVLAILIMFFGLTFVISRLTFSWFGIFIELIAIVILSLATGAWYIDFMIFVNVILIIYSFILATSINNVSIAG